MKQKIKRKTSSKLCKQKWSARSNLISRAKRELTTDIVWWRWSHTRTNTWIICCVLSVKKFIHELKFVNATHKLFVCCIDANDLILFSRFHSFLCAYCECKFLNRKLAVLTMKESFIFWIHHQIRLNSMYDLYYHHHPNKTTGILLNKNKTEKIVNFNNEKIREPNKKRKRKREKTRILWTKCPQPTTITQLIDICVISFFLFCSVLIPESSRSENGDIEIINRKKQENLKRLMDNNSKRKTKKYYHHNYNINNNNEKKSAKCQTKSQFNKWLEKKKNRENNRIAQRDQISHRTTFVVVVVIFGLKFFDCLNGGESSH